MPDLDLHPPSHAFSTARLQTPEFEMLRELIYAETGISLSPAKRVLVESRLSRRLRALGLSSFESYCDYVAEALDRELVPLINCITTNKTDFFRESHHFQYLRNHVLPAVEARAKRTGRRRLRIWSAGCSTGEEPYSIALVLREWLQSHAGWDVRILASDIDTNVLETAANGCYAADRLLDVPAEWRKRWFCRIDESDPSALLEIDPGVRELVTFRRINLNDEPWPIRTTFDVVFCRNVIIYFDRATQTRLLSRMVQLLEPDGHLIIGHSESLAWMTDFVTSVRGVPSVYTLSAIARTRQNPPLRREISVSPAPSASAPAPSALPHAPQPKQQSPAPASAPQPTQPSSAPASAPQPTPPSPAFASAPQPTQPSPAFASVSAPARELASGEVRSSASAEVLHTVLGSCVAVAIFDPESRIGGLNHFVLPAPVSVQEPEQEASARYGVQAMPHLIEQLRQLGAVTTRMRAKLFGGAAVTTDDRPDSVGAANVAAAREFLAQAGIPIVAERVGGSASIELFFETDSGRARVRELRGAA